VRFGSDLVAMGIPWAASRARLLAQFGNVSPRWRDVSAGNAGRHSGASIPQPRNWGEARGSATGVSSRHLFLASVVRKKLGLTLQSDKPDGERVYRVIEPQAA
jgi:hypothetical protein